MDEKIQSKQDNVESFNKDEISNNTSPDEKKKKMRQYISYLGPYLWILNFINALGPWLVTFFEFWDDKKLFDRYGWILRLLGFDTSNYLAIYEDPLRITNIDWIIWLSVSLLFAFIISIVVIKPIGKFVKKNDWESIVMDRCNFGKFKIPQVLLWSFIQCIICGGWGGAFMFVFGLFVLYIVKKDIK